MENSWISELKSKDIPFEFRDLSTKIGMEATLEVLEYFQGATIYFPKINGGNFEKPRFRAMQKRLAELKADGVKKATKIIAREFKLSERRIRQIFHSDSS